MHATGTVRLGCTDCHGGNADVRVAAGVAASSPEYEQVKQQAHPQPRDPELADRSANPERAVHSVAEGKPGVRALRQSRRSARRAGNVRQRRLPRFGSAQRVDQHDDDRRNAVGRGALQQRRVSSQGHAIRRKLRARRHAANRSNDSAAVRRRNADEGHPAGDHAARTLGDFAARQRAARVRTRRRPKGRSRRALARSTKQASPTTSSARADSARSCAPIRFFSGCRRRACSIRCFRLPGTNDQPGDYRASGCTACHVVYANDRSPEHSAQYAPFGNRGFSASNDPTIPRDESGHPIRHEFTRSIPSSQCMVCHVHPGTNMVTTYFGYTWWDNESDGDAMYPKEQRQSDRGRKIRGVAAQSRRRGRARAVVRPEISGGNGQRRIQCKIEDTQFADFHSHGWLFRAVFARDRQGHLLDEKGSAVAARRSEEIREGRAPRGHSPAKRNAVRGLPLRAGQPRQRKTLRRAARGDRTRLRRLPRHDFAARDAGHVGPSGARGRHAPRSAAHAVGRAAIRVARRQTLSSAR